MISYTILSCVLFFALVFEPFYEVSSFRAPCRREIRFARLAHYAVDLIQMVDIYLFFYLVCIFSLVCLNVFQLVRLADGLKDGLPSAQRNVVSPRPGI